MVSAVPGSGGGVSDLRLVGPTDKAPGRRAKKPGYKSVSKLDERVLETIVGYVRAGNFFNVACAAAGVTQATATDWLMTGETGGPLKPRPIHRRFALAIREAEAAAEAHAVLVVRKAINEGDARAAIEYLRRRHPERWGDRAALAVDHRMQVVHQATPAELAAFSGEGEIIDAEAYEELDGRPLDRSTGELTRTGRRGVATDLQQDVDEIRVAVDAVVEEEPGEDPHLEA